MRATTIKVLLIEDDPGDARLLEEMLREAGSKRILNTTFIGVKANRLQEGLDCLATGEIEVVLLDLSLPDAYGIHTFDAVQAKAPQLPIVIVSGLDDEELAMDAVNRGAQDYLVKGHVDAHLLCRSIRYSIKRKRIESRLRGLALVDEKTGTYTQAAFFSLAKYHLKLAQKTWNGFVYGLATVEDLDNINETFGPQEGEQALMDAARLLRRTVGEDNIVARTHPERFFLILDDISRQDIPALQDELQERVDEYNQESGQVFRLNLSLVLLWYDPVKPCSVVDLMKHAETAERSEAPQN